MALTAIVAFQTNGHAAPTVSSVSMVANNIKAGNWAIAPDLPTVNLQKTKHVRAVDDTACRHSVGSTGWPEKQAHK